MHRAVKIPGSVVSAARATLSRCKVIEAYLPERPRDAPPWTGADENAALERLVSVSLTENVIAPASEPQPATAPEPVRAQGLLESFGGRRERDRKLVEALMKRSKAGFRRGIGNPIIKNTAWRPERD